ncbi:aminoglycoside phosphotransferase family protein [Streptomyces lunaelactis]|uniref:phosphotransferase family protein n=1 Tax=Streptomyces lunaelactis TaxID=1535768 RepID=UPI0015847142|nr:aminoglycoside phosphotransferase family protein [Streptomyces lunaelactis]NUK04357.1 aminoglycoside phosphotransferase family protein [Streptomyces lunaelactis]NUK06442.1 aminoglycoside phosphotransferase family protein [Streptomyces lunaelactis]NUK18809.1 aminoglycoside phosphotransferase family protein [Streptomyces lunaelactis]NUK36296.1 aminoglycoside phosphotransferase family protein [Streptomyces lunaelactis]NUK42820.1 aminoglycoside phosphotransferase family protein [Streptomyces lu
MEDAFPRVELWGSRLRGLLPLRPLNLLTRPADLLTARRLANRLRADTVCFRDLHGLQRTVSDLLVFQLEGKGTQPPLVVKYPCSSRAAASLAQGCDVVRQLTRDDRLDEWRRLLPTVEECRLGGPFPLVAEGRLPGVEGNELLRRAPERTRPVAVSALRAVGDLHRATGRPEPVATRVREWVDPRLAVLAEEIRWCRQGPGAAATEALRDRLIRGLAGRTLTVAWTHGDYHPGNIMLSEEHGTLTGVIDWADARPDGPCAIDSYIFVLALRQQLGGRQLGRIVADVVRRGSLLPDDRRLLTEADVPPPDEDADEAVLPLLTWLWHVAGNAAKSARYGRSNRWVAGNVVPVLRAVAGR